MPTKERKTDRKVRKLKPPTRKDAVPAVPEGPRATPEALLAESMALVRSFQEAMQGELDSGKATPGLAREAASLARANAILTKEQRDQEKHARARFERLTDKERAELALDLVVSLPKAVRLEALRRLQESLAKKEAA